jgi:hypothetical protein
MPFLNHKTARKGIGRLMGPKWGRKRAYRGCLEGPRMENYEGPSLAIRASDRQK